MTTQVAVAHTREEDSITAGESLGRELAAAMGAVVPDAVIVFASPRYDPPGFLKALKAASGTTLLLGCSSAGEFTRNVHGEGLACAVAIRSDDLSLAGGLGRGISAGCSPAVKELVQSFRVQDLQPYPYRTALVMVDAMAGNTEELVEELTLQTAASYQLVGGGAGDNARFESTKVFWDTEAYEDAVVALEILSKKPIGLGVEHGWVPRSAPMRVTEAEGTRLVSLNATPVLEVLQRYAEETGQTLDLEVPLPFLLHNVLGIHTALGYRLRVPLAINADGSITCAADVPSGAIVHFMTTDDNETVAATGRATNAALAQLKGHRPKLGLFFDCPATRTRLGRAFQSQLEAIQERLGDAYFVGCNTHGQLVREEGQFNGFHNCTAVVCLIPE